MKKLELQKCIVGSVYTNCYFLKNKETGELLIVDPGDAADMIERKVSEMQGKPVGILLTHGHFDHIIGIPEIINYKKIPVYIGENDFEFLYDSTLSLSLWSDMDFTLSKDIEVIKLKENDEVFGFKVINTPGHTHGGICYYNIDENVMFSGDTIFKMSHGRTDLPTGNMKELEQTLEELFKLNSSILIYPGHGGTTTIGAEKQNSFFGF